MSSDYRYAAAKIKVADLLRMMDSIDYSDADREIEIVLTVGPGAPDQLSFEDDGVIDSADVKVIDYGNELRNALS